jgi:chromosome segregation ATPase
LTVNFIHGQNGSGKSAILAAIQICLGAGARRTHRARNLAELIRKESNVGQAKISVTLRNEGEDGFYPELYGNAITVERVISNRSGAGGYKLINASTGKTVSTSKKDLDAMLDHLNIQVENPVAVLDQGMYFRLHYIIYLEDGDLTLMCVLLKPEEAKKFLTGKPEDKYRFFQTATELERLDRTYGDVADSVAELEANESHVEAGLQTSIQNVKRLKKEVEKFQELEILEDKIAESRLKQAWAVFGEVQKDKDMLESVSSIKCMVRQLKCHPHES